MLVPKRAQKGAALAALSLAVAAVVLIVTPMVIAAPNPLEPVAAVVVAVGCAGALLGGQWGNRIAVTVSWAGLALSALWLVFATDGFGKGTPWWDDLIEAAVLAAALYVAAILPWSDRGDRQPAGNLGGATE
jgi:hypothetical protein